MPKPAKFALIASTAALATVIGYVTASAPKQASIRITNIEEERAVTPAQSSTSTVTSPTRPSRSGTVYTRRRAAEEVRQKLFRKSLNEIFEEESRDEAWAGPVEKVLRDVVEPYQRVLMPYATGVAVECRTNICEVGITVPVDKQTEAYSLIQGIPLGEMRGPSAAEDPASPGEVRITLSAAFAEGRTEPGDVEEDLRRELDKRFPDGYAIVRAHIDSHPDVFEPKPSEGQLP